ncbi:MAG: UPF0182 family protein [Chloroflexota bacterium]|nr:UPF0182 family protein [Chloroflexota bacterium]
MLVTAVIIAGLFALVFATASFWVNWWWFDSVGYQSVLMTRYIAQLITFLLGGLIGAAVFGGNIVLALRRSRRLRPAGSGRPGVDRLLLPILLVATGTVFVLAGVATARRWPELLLLFNSRSFGVTTPVLGRDVGFYVFALPVLHFLRNALLPLLAATTLAVAVIYVVRLGFNPRNYRRVPVLMRTHLLVLIGGFLLLVAASYWLANYDLAYSDRGVVFGAGYTDVNARRWANWILALVTGATALLLALSGIVGRVRWVLGALAGWAVLAVLLGVVYPAAVQRTVVEPSELRHEAPYIANNIAMTWQAHDLEDVVTRELSGGGTTSAADLAAQSTTIENIRLWDYRVVRETYAQNHTFVPYYAFDDVDVDRYMIDGQIRQVLVAARELNVEGLPETAQTWLNRHLRYTHGYGVVVSPVGGVTQQDLPTMLVSGFPPNGTGPLAIERPEIYFGERPGDWVVVGTDQEEFTGLSEVAQAGGYAGAGRGSIGTGNVFSRLILATHLRDRNLLLSGSISDESRVLLRRGVVERATTIAPFLTYDPDPYIVIDQGRLFWILDAYTSTDRYPYATPTQGINYLRNSVKVVVDAYDGTTTFYRTAAPDPIADAYARIFDDLFAPIADVPPGIAAHFRYPEVLFDIQSEIYAAHHVTDPRMFYDGDDRWEIPQEEAGGSIQRMEPYYVTLTLPEEQEPGFALIRPFTPGGRQERQNMTAWMAGRAGPEGSTEIVVYRFPRQAIVFGPQQVEARIDQEPDISAQITLLDQSGSEVIRGNLLVIPIGDSVVYVQPLYLRASETPGAYPELKRVIVASNERVVMEPTLAGALASLTAPTAGDAPLPAPPDAVTEAPLPSAPDVSPAQADLAQQALDAYTRGQAALARGDWTAYGAEQANLEAILRQLAGETVTLDAGNVPPSSTPAP